MRRAQKSKKNCACHIRSVYSNRFHTVAPILCWNFLTRNRSLPIQNFYSSCRSSVPGHRRSKRKSRRQKVSSFRNRNACHRRHRSNSRLLSWLFPARFSSIEIVKYSAFSGFLWYICTLKIILGDGQAYTQRQSYKD